MARILQIITGHCYCSKYYEKMKINKDTYCPQCKRKKNKIIVEDRAHILLHCWKGTIAHDNLKKQMKNINLCFIMGNLKAQEALMEFIDQTGCFTSNRKPLELWKPTQPPPEPPPHERAADHNVQPDTANA